MKLISIFGGGLRERKKLSQRQPKLSQVVAVGTVEDDEISNDCDGVNQMWLFPELARIFPFSQCNCELDKTRWWLTENPRRLLGIILHSTTHPKER